MTCHGSCVASSRCYRATTCAHHREINRKRASRREKGGGGGGRGEGGREREREKRRGGLAAKDIRSERARARERERERQRRARSLSLTHTHTHTHAHAHTLVRTCAQVVYDLTLYSMFNATAPADAKPHDRQGGQEDLGEEGAGEYNVCVCIYTCVCVCVYTCV
jgi:hypothetical protein